MVKAIFISLNSYTALFVLEEHLDGYMRGYFENETVISNYIIVESRHKYSVYAITSYCRDTAIWL